MFVRLLHYPGTYLLVLPRRPILIDVVLVMLLLKSGTDFHSPSDNSVPLLFKHKKTFRFNVSLGGGDL